MDCEEFLEDYSDFLDRRFEEHRLFDYSQHLLSCATCAEYDTVVRRGLHLVRRLDPPDSNPDFSTRLRRSVLELERGTEPYLGDRRLGALAVAVTLAALLVLAGLPVVYSGGGAVQLPPVVVETPPRSTVLALWGPAPRFAPSVSLLQVDIEGEPLFAPPSERLSVFRAPLSPTNAASASEASAPE